MTGQGYGGIAGEINYEATAGGVGSRCNQGVTAFERSGGGVVGLESPAAATTHIGGIGEGATGFGATPRFSTGVPGEESVVTAGVGALSDANHDGVLSPTEFNVAGY